MPIPPESHPLHRSLPGEDTTAGAPSSAAPLPDPEPGQVFAHFQILEPLGRGGFGAVWRALDLRLDREVALKFLAGQVAANPSARGLLEAEARTVAALTHPGVVTLHALEEAEGRLFLVMERITGQPLADHIPAQGLTRERLLDLGLQLTDALGAAHDLGIIHRDLNPRNIMVTPEGRVKILDFGLALRSAAQTSPSRDPGATSGRLTGTLPYLAPEQVRGLPPETRSDLFSLGVVLFEATCGRRPFQGTTAAELLAAIQGAEPAWPEEAGPDLIRVLRRCLEKAPEARYPGCRELHLALSRLAAATPAPPGSLAVLPFQDLSPERDASHLCEGLAESLAEALGRVPALRVLSRTATSAYRDAPMALPELGQRLGVDRIVGGSLTPEEDHVRVRVELIDTASGYTLWSETRRTPRTDLPGLGEAMALALAEGLAWPMAPRSRSRSMGPDAYEDLLRARQYYFRYDRHGMRFARHLFQQALDRDPSCAEAWAGLANCAAFLYIYVDRREAHRSEAEEASRRALELDADLAEAHASRGVALSATGEDAAATEAFERAQALDPNLYEAVYFHARHCFAHGRLDQAMALFERAAALNPEDCQAPLLVAQVHASLGQPEAAAEARRRGLALAEARLRRVPDDVRTRYLAANALVALGERERGLAWARMVRGLAPDDPMLLYNLGCIHALAGEADAALDCLEEAVMAGLTQRGWFLNDGDLAAVRTHPRFQALLDGLPETGG